MTAVASADEPLLERSGPMLLVAAAALIFLIYAWPRLNLPLGDSHDGRNAAVWLTSAKAIDRLGVFGSRLGAARSDGSVYANHPPAIVGATWLSIHLTGSHRIGARLPAVVGSVASLVLMYLVLCELALSRLAASFGVLVGFTVPMFNVYGAMLDTPILGLPLGLAVVLFWLRGRRGRPVSAAVAGAISALAVLTAWQCWLIVGLVGMTAIAARVRSGRGSWVPIVVGGTAGAVLVIAWQFWVFGSLANLRLQFLVRTGSNGAALSLGDALRSQRTAICDQVPAHVLVLAGLGLLLGTVRRETRACVGLMIVTVVIYTIGLKGGALYHDYWSYWIVALLGLGCAVATAEGIRLLTNNTAMSARAILILGALGAVLVLQPKTHHSQAGRRIEFGAHVVSPALQLPRPVDQIAAWCVGGMCEAAPWIGVETGLDMVWLRSPDALAAVAANRPGDVIIMGGEVPAWSNQSDHHGQPFAVRARETFGAK